MYNNKLLRLTLYIYLGTLYITIMIDFSKCVIYLITCKDPAVEDSYIGSTCDFKRRVWEHGNYTNNYKRPEHTYPLYRTIRDKGGWNNWNVRILEEYKNCENIHEKRLCERKWIEEINPSLNCRIPGRSKAEWKKDNVEKQREYTRRSREKKKKEKQRLLMLEEAKKQEKRLNMAYIFGENYVELV